MSVPTAFFPAPCPQLNNKAAFPLAMVVVRLAHYVPELLDALLAILQQVGYLGAWLGSGWRACAVRRFGCVREPAGRKAFSAAAGGVRCVSCTAFGTGLQQVGLRCLTPARGFRISTGSTLARMTTSCFMEWC